MGTGHRRTATTGLATVGKPLDKKSWGEGHRPVLSCRSQDKKDGGGCHGGRSNANRGINPQRATGGGTPQTLLLENVGKRVPDTIFVHSNSHFTPLGKKKRKRGSKERIVRQADPTVVTRSRWQETPSTSGAGYSLMGGGGGGEWSILKCSKEAQSWLKDG